MTSFHHNDPFMNLDKMFLAGHPGSLLPRTSTAQTMEAIWNSRGIAAPGEQRVQRPSSRQQQQQREQKTSSRYQQTPADLEENDQCIRLTVDLPGVLIKDLHVAVQHGVLSIKGVRKTWAMDGLHCNKKHKFSRRYAIDTDVVDVSQIEANLVHGVLTIKAPKKSQPQHVKITVTENDEEDEKQPEVTVVTTSDADIVTTETPTSPSTPPHSAATQPAAALVSVPSPLHDDTSRPVITLKDDDHMIDSSNDEDAPSHIR